MEKRPVIENKLLTGRQLLASETAPSDTSDSDSEYRAELSTDFREVFTEKGPHKGQSLY